MTTTVEATYEDGKLVLPQRLPLPEHSLVRVTIETGDTERGACLKLAEASLMNAWADPGDDVFNELLEK